MNELDHGRVRRRAWLGYSVDLRRQQEERRPQHLPLHEHEMLAHAVQEGAVDRDDAPHLVTDARERSCHRRLNVSECYLSRRRGPGTSCDLVSFPRAATRSATSRNSMATAKTRRYDGNASAGRPRCSVAYAMRYRTPTSCWSSLPGTSVARCRRAAAIGYCSFSTKHWPSAS